MAHIKDRCALVPSLEAILLLTAEETNCHRLYDNEALNY